VGRAFNGHPRPAPDRSLVPQIADRFDAARKTGCQRTALSGRSKFTADCGGYTIAKALKAHVDGCCRGGQELSFGSE
jgi:hypothetical protein